MAAHEYYNVNQFISQSAANGTSNESLENDQTGFMSKPAVKITQVVLKELIFHFNRPLLSILAINPAKIVTFRPFLAEDWLVLAFRKISGCIDVGDLNGKICHQYLVNNTSRLQRRSPTSM